jgi:predicted  nucleic acid-binding Zn-ribbon protein
MMNLNPSLPAVPTDNALTYAMTLLAVASDPAGTKARMDELVAQITAVHAATAEHDAAKKTADEAASAAADVERRGAELDQRAAELASERTRVDVAAAANASRQESLNTLQQALDGR